MTTIVVSRPDRQLVTIDVEGLRALLASPDASDAVVWVDLENPSTEEEDLYLGEIFDFHPLAIQDCRRERLNPERGDHLPKVEDYDRYLFSIINPIDAVPRTTKEQGEPRFYLETRQLNVFLGECFIVTHHYEPCAAITLAHASRQKNPGLIHRGPDYLYHMILNDIVDQYSPILDEYDLYIDELEEEIFHQPNGRTLAKILDMKREIFRLRRITVYQREMVFRLSRGDYDLITQEEIAYYRNVFDHLVRAADLTESYRDVLTGLIDAYLSMTSNRMNEIMKVLTIISTVFLPLTFIVGLYGMNFTFMPELHWRYGYLFAWVLMIATVGLMLFFFRKKRWL
jgi:magnesium transporter